MEPDSAIVKYVCLLQVCLLQVWVFKASSLEHLAESQPRRDVTLSKDEAGRKALGDLTRRGRHFGVAMHVLTRRVTDWFDTEIGCSIRNTSANQWYDQMDARELCELAPSLGLSPEERELIERAGQGEGLLVTAGRRVWINLYGHTSPHEFEVFNTDRDEGAVELSVDRRNGRWLAALQGSARSQ